MKFVEGKMREMQESAICTRSFADMITQAEVRVAYDAGRTKEKEKIF